MSTFSGESGPSPLARAGLARSVSRCANECDGRTSLRSKIGVVPQAPVLFDDTIMNNVRYAKLDATDEEVHDACKAASIHNQILGFTDGMDAEPASFAVGGSGVADNQPQATKHGLASAA